MKNVAQTTDWQQAFDALGEQVDLNTELTKDNGNAVLCRVIGESGVEFGIESGDSIMVDMSVKHSSTGAVLVRNADKSFYIRDAARPPLRLVRNDDPPFVVNDVIGLITYIIRRAA